MAGILDYIRWRGDLSFAEQGLTFRRFIFLSFPLDLTTGGYDSIQSAEQIPIKRPPVFSGRIISSGRP